MPASHPNSASVSRFGPYAGFVMPPVDEAIVALDPGERVGGPIARRRRRWLVPFLLIAFAAAGAWAWHAHRDEMLGLSATLAQMMRSPSPVPQVAQREQQAPLPELGPEKVLEPVLPPKDAPAEVPERVADADPAMQEPPSVTDAAVEKLAPVVADPHDALQQRALAAGLHPGLSPALLERLTAADFKNAAHAVRMALSRGSENRIFMWPKQREPELALFTVKFVAGAPRDCLRYVVIILKDRWQTTASPMERCGPARNLEKGS